MSDIILNRLIDQEIERMGLDKRKVQILPEVIEITSPVQSIDLGLDLYIIVNEKIDMPESHNKLVIESADRLFITSSVDYENSRYYKYQLFKDYMKVSVTNYVTFNPFKLEFLKIMPVRENEE